MALVVRRALNRWDHAPPSRSNASPLLFSWMNWSTVKRDDGSGTDGQFGSSLCREGGFSVDRDLCLLRTCKPCQECSAPTPVLFAFMALHYCVMHEELVRELSWRSAWNQMCHFADWSSTWPCQGWRHRKSYAAFLNLPTGSPWSRNLLAKQPPCRRAKPYAIKGTPSPKISRRAHRRGAPPSKASDHGTSRALAELRASALLQENASR